MEFMQKAKCYDKKLHSYLYNENNGLYSDFMSLQWAPTTINDHLAEPITWRDDLKCGDDWLNPMGTPAQCSQPYTGTSADEARCCKDSNC